jgi:tetratricopeptide (TPR) repeat protein
MRWILFFLLVGAVMADEDLPDLDKLWDFGKPDETEKRFRELLPRAEAAGDRDYLLQLKTQIARTLGLQGRFDQAHAVLDDVELALAGKDGDLPTVRIRLLLERGRAFNSSKQPEKARPLFLHAWDLGLEKGIDRYAVDAAHMMAIVEPPEKRDAWNRKAMELAEKSKDEAAKRWLGTLYNNMGWDAHDAGDYARALELHEKCLAWHMARDPKSGGTRIAKWSVARQLRALGRTEEALGRQRELLAEYEALGKEDGFVYEEIGECLLALGREAEAKPWFRKAVALLEKIDWVREDRPRLDRLRKLGEE